MHVLLSFAYVPFTLALALLAGLFALEAVALLAGASFLTGGHDGPDLDTGAVPLEGTFDLDPGAAPDVAQLVAASEALHGGDHGAGAGTAETGGAAGFLGLGHTPFMMWLAALLFGFGLSGLVLQSLAAAALGAALPAGLAAGAGAAAGLGFARSFSRRFGRLLPAVETTATSAQFMGGLRGVVSQGTARRGSPAEVRLQDRHGNIHYLRCEPFAATDVIAEGSRVLTLRERLGPDRWSLRILPID
ncbi:MAG: OB-fold-containig protein [Paracoccaceae bacterium]